MQTSDAAQRMRALDPENSFIVQSPAGSGKTELLIQRFLTLLGRVSRPEEIIAITFTRKAAGEMRRRIMEALHKSAEPRPAEPHKGLTWDLAYAVRERSERLKWRLMDNPGRLRIQTIDSLCASIARQMPWLSRLGGPPEVVENAEELYDEAARGTIGLLEDDRWSADIGTLLTHVDNNFKTLQDLIAGMLGRRDQWLRHVTSSVEHEHNRMALERGLSNVILDAVARAREALPAGLDSEVIQVAAKAGAYLRSDNREGHALACIDFTILPGPERLDVWLGIADTFLTQKGDWRKSLTVSNGFPPGDKPFKQRGSQLIAALSGNELLRLALNELRYLPDAVFSEPQWNVLASLVRLLPVATDQLRRCFRERGACDFVEVGIAARRALENPEVTADNPVRHILIDEFQDTSVSQFSLLEALTAGWKPGDGSTIFAVGDPMQSIYRFREAEVGLFLKTCREGIGGLPLEALQLSSNFRSDQGIVDWVNDSFPEILPAEDDITTGAIKFCRSEAVHPPRIDPAVTIHPFIGSDDQAEAAEVVNIIKSIRGAAEKADSKIAILVRARSHLKQIVPALRAAGLKFRAVEIDPLAGLPVIQDLTALTRALIHPADRIAWLALLRAPWCGMTLEELHTLAGSDMKRTVWDLIADELLLERLEPDARGRLDRIREVLNAAIASRPASLRSSAEGVWLALGGPACCSKSDIENAAAFFRLLEEMDEGGTVDMDAFMLKISELYATPDVDADETLQIMSIHKAKGLEFDVVIVPGLGRTPKSDDRKLMLWLERPRIGKDPDLLLAPIHATGADRDSIYDYLKRVENLKSEHESGRLLYVAFTRAKSELHLLGDTGYSVKDGIAELKKPESTSLLSRMWEVAGPFFREAFNRFSVPENEMSLGERKPQTIGRLSAEWRFPQLPSRMRSEEKTIQVGNEEETVSFRWVGDTLRHVGTVVHQMLKYIAEDGISKWDEERLRGKRQAYLSALASLGVPAAELEHSAQKVEAALVRALSDERGRWLLGTHKNAACEYPVSGFVEGRIVSARIDRTFIDETGTRWVIDYKSSSHEGAGVDAFLDNERERYRDQMKRYRVLFEMLEKRPVRVALYFPLLNAWRELGTLSE